MIINYVASECLTRLLHKPLNYQVIYHILCTLKSQDETLEMYLAHSSLRWNIPCTLKYKFLAALCNDLHNFSFTLLQAMSIYMSLPVPELHHDQPVQDETIHRMTVWADEQVVLYPTHQLSIMPLLATNGLQAFDLAPPCSIILS